MELENPVLASVGQEFLSGHPTQKEIENQFYVKGFEERLMSKDQELKETLQNSAS